jgi:hypothetical protein
MFKPPPLDPRLLDELSKNISNLIPSDLKVIKDDFEKNVRIAIQSGFSRLDLVGREEFDVQTAVLEKTRAKLDALVEKVAELEK